MNRSRVIVSGMHVTWQDSVLLFTFRFHCCGFKQLWLGTEATYHCKEDGHLFDAGNGEGYDIYKSTCTDLGIYDLGYVWTNRIPECKAGLKKIPRKYCSVGGIVSLLASVWISDCRLFFMRIVLCEINVSVQWKEIKEFTNQGCLFSDSTALYCMNDTCLDSHCTM